METIAAASEQAGAQALSVAGIACGAMVGLAGFGSGIGDHGAHGAIVRFDRWPIKPVLSQGQ
jgi:hypothetical protein